jgi:hypothetical protein
MPCYVLHHHHEPSECAAVYAAWHGFRSPLRRQAAPSTCLVGDHSIWWHVEADDEPAALALLPRFVAHRTRPIAVREVEIP